MSSAVLNVCRRIAVMICRHGALMDCLRCAVIACRRYAVPVCRRGAMTALVLALPTAAFAGTCGANPADSLTILGERVHKIAVDPVVSGQIPLTNAIDTLPSDVPGVNIVLFNDNTWAYVKTSDYIAQAGIFTSYWDEKKVNPYNFPIDSIPETWSVWMVDALSSYHVPQTGRVTSKFGMRYGRRHQGVDISLPTGTPLYATFDGVVRVSMAMNGYGHLVVIRHNNGLETFYGHMSRRDVNPGDAVKAGDIIGLSGNTGRSTGPHLHYEIRYDGLALDPQRIIDFSNGNMRQRMMVLKRRYFDSASRYDQNFDDEFLNMEDDAKALAAQKKKQEEEALKAQVWHTVRNGECLSTIARKYHTSVSAICRMNKISASSTLRAGRRLRVR